MFRSNLLGFHLCHMCANASRHQDTTHIIYINMARSFKYLNIFRIGMCTFWKNQFRHPFNAHTNAQCTQPTHTHILCCSFHWLIAIFLSYPRESRHLINYLNTITKNEKYKFRGEEKRRKMKLQFGAPILASKNVVFHHLDF